MKYWAYFDQSEDFFGIADADDCRSPVAKLVYDMRSKSWIVHLQQRLSKNCYYDLDWMQAYAEAIVMAVAKANELNAIIYQPESK